MEIPTDDARRALRQFLSADGFFGVRELPVPRTALIRRNPAVRAPGASAASPAARTPVSADSGDAAARLADLERDHVRDCRKCRLCQGRTNTVFGAGDPQARLVFVGEGPGFEEDRQGVPFVGRAGELLSRMIIAMGLRRNEVYICNVVKCRPPNNRDPEADEILACSPYLHEQLRIIHPEMIVTLGAPAARTLLDSTDGIGRLRGRFHDFRLKDPLGEDRIIPLMPTYHPAYLLRKPEDKGKTWADLQQVMGRLGLTAPQRR